MSKSNNNVEKIIVRIFRTKKNEILFVIKNANAGFQYVVIQPELLPNGDINQVAWINASKLNIAQDVEDLVKAIYSKVKRPIPAAAGCQVLASYRAVLDADLSLACYSDKLPCEVMNFTEKDNSGLTLKDYVLNTFGYPDSNGNLTVGFELEDINVIDQAISGVFKEYDIAGHDPYNNLDGSDAVRLTPHTNQILKDSVKNSKLYKQIMEYLKFNDEALNQKGILIYGIPGTGKTTAVRVMAEEVGLPYAVITGNPALTEEDLFGYVIPNDDPNKPQHWITAWTDVLKVAQAGGVVVFDEANNFSPAVQIGLNNVVYGENRFIKFQDKVYQVHPKTIFVVTTNFGEQGNNPMNGAFKQRFYPILATEFNAEQYAAYLSNLYPAIDPKALVEYTKFMYQAIDYTRKTFDNLDRYSPDTPALYTRAISQILTMAFTKHSLKQALGDFIFAITHGVEDNKTKTQGFLAQFDKEISSIEQMFFMNKQIIKDAKKTLGDLLSVGVASLGTNVSSTNADDIFNKANSVDSSSANSIIDGLDNLDW